MVNSISVSEINKLLKNENGAPHSVLGMHEEEFKGKKCVAVREIFPDAVKVEVVDSKNNRSYELMRIHDDGFYEGIIPNRVKYFDYYLRIQYANGTVWEVKDQYTFSPSISEYDRYLYGAGNHYEIYKKLGSHVVTLDGTEGVSFSVWAPNAKSVSVIGTFNSWDPRRNMMRCLGESGIWELFIPGVKEFDIYKYSIKAQDGNVVDKADPMGNYSEVRPQTASIVYDLSGYEWKDQQWIDYRENENQFNKPMNIYEVHLGSWMKVPEEDNRCLTYKELADKLVKYVKEMGYTHVEFMPLSEYPFDGSWGYQVTGYYAVTSRYGTPKDFMALVDEFHQNGIGVIMDWVPAHFPKDAHGLARFDGTALYEHADSRIGEHLEWGTYIFNYGRKEVSNFLISNALFWIKEFHIDGLRVDAVSSMLYLDYDRDDGQWIPNIYGGRENLEAVEFLKHMNSVVSREEKGVMMIAEESTSWDGATRCVDYGGLGFDLKWNMGWMNDFLTYFKKETVHRKYHHNDLTFSMVYAYSEKFALVLSHDEVVHGKGSIMGKAPGDIWQKAANLRVAYGYMFGHPGKKLLFMGGEFGQFEEWRESKSLDWHLLEYDTHKNLHNYMKDLNNFYKNQPALWERDFDQWGFEWIEAGDYVQSILSFIRRGNAREEQLVVVCNFTEAPYDNFLVGVTEECDYEEVFNSDDVKYGGTGGLNEGTISNTNIPYNGRDYSVSITIPPLGFVVLKPKF